MRVPRLDDRRASGVLVGVVMVEWGGEGMRHYQCRPETPVRRIRRTGTGARRKRAMSSESHS